MCLACQDGLKLPNGWKCDVCGHVKEKPSDRAIEVAKMIWNKKDTSVFTIATIIDEEAVQEIARLQEMQNKRLNDYGVNAGSMLRKELRAVIHRYGQESSVTVYQLIGCLEVVKQDILDMMDIKESK